MFGTTWQERPPPPRGQHLPKLGAKAAFGNATQGKKSVRDSFKH